MLVFFSEYTNCGYIRENSFYPVPVFVVAAANNISQLPPELLHKGRFDEIFFVDLPDRAEREDRVESADRSESRDPTLRNDPVEKAENTDRTDPTDPIDRIDPAEPIDRSESVLAIDHRERVDRSG